MNNKNNDLSIVVNTCDSYADVLKLFFAAFDEYWPECEYNVYINTEQNQDNYGRATIINYHAIDGIDRWGDRLLKALSFVDSEFVLMLYDDFILEASIDKEIIKNIIELMKKDPDASVSYLINTNLPIQADSAVGSFSLVKDRCDYRLNSAPAIWRKSDLMRFTGKNDNPWAWEIFGSYRTYDMKNNFYTIAPGIKDIYQYDYCKGGAIYRGRWVRAVVAEKFDRYKLDIEPSIRGYSEDALDESRSFAWKIKFMITGFRMVGFKSAIFIVRYLKAKLYA